MKHLTLIFSIFFIALAIFPDIVITIVITIINIVPYNLGFGVLVDPIALKVDSRMEFVTIRPQYSLFTSIALLVMSVVGLLAYIKEVKVNQRNIW